MHFFSKGGFCIQSERFENLKKKSWIKLNFEFLCQKYYIFIFVHFVLQNSLKIKLQLGNKNNY